MSNQVSMTESRKTFPQTSSVRTVISGNIGMVDKSETKNSSSNLQKIKFKLPNVGQHLRSWLRLKNSKKSKSKEDVTSSKMTDAYSIVPNITEEILERALPESSTWDERINENRVLQTSDNPLTKSRLAFSGCPSVSFTPDDESTFPSTSSSNPRLTTSEAIIEKIMSEASTIQISSSNPSASALPSNVVVNGIPGINLGNIVNDAIPHDPVDFLLAINSQIGSQTGRERDTTNAPLYLMNESRTESYGGSSTSGNVSNTTGSDDSSMSEMVESIESQSEQDPNQQYYEVILSIIRKQFESLDDDPPIY